MSKKQQQGKWIKFVEVLKYTIAIIGGLLYFLGEYADIVAKDSKNTEKFVEAVLSVPIDVVVKPLKFAKDSALIAVGTTSKIFLDDFKRTKLK